MAPPTASTHLSPAELSFLHASLSSQPPIRPDSRLATDFRPLNAETGVLPNTMGSAHVGFADGREAVVGVRAEVEKTAKKYARAQDSDQDAHMEGTSAVSIPVSRGRPEWITLGLSLPGLRDDDKDLVFLEELLREVLITPPSTVPLSQDRPAAQSLQDALVINRNWHWHLYIDVLLISAQDAASGSTGAGASTASTSPLPLLSMAIHLALRDTRIPRLKSEGDEDPVANDDWDESIYLYSHTNPGKQDSVGLVSSGTTPAITLLVMAVGDNIIFDPSATELAVADGVWAISVAKSNAGTAQNRSIQTVKILGVRMLETSARDTMKGVPRDTDPADPNNAAQAQGFNLGSGTDQVVPGVWKPKVGGVRRGIVVQALKAVVGKDGSGAGAEVLQSLDGFHVSGS